MSSAKGFPGQNGGWTQPRSPAVAGQEPDLAPANGYGQQGYGAGQAGFQDNGAHQRPNEPTWGQHARQPQTSAAPQAPRHPGWDVSDTGSYGGQAYPAAPNGAANGARSHQQAPAPAAYGAPDAYAPQFQPYVPPSQPRPQAQAPQAAYPPAGQPSRAPAGSFGGQYAQPAPRWGAPHAAQQPDARGYPPQAAQVAPAGDFGGYRGTDRPVYGSPEAAPLRADWQQHANPGAYNSDSYHQPVDEFGFAQAAGGELDPAYGEDDQDYEYEEPSRIRRPLMIVAALAGAIMVGGGLAFGYKTFVGDTGSGSPPVIKSAEAPSRTKPADAGGKQFAHSDSKIMGRMGDGSAAVAAGGAAAATDGASAGASEQDSSGTRKVSTLVVGRDGSIQAPAVSVATTDSGVPGLTVVDAFGAQAAAAAPQVVNTPAAAPSQPVAVATVSPPQPAPTATGSVEDASDRELAVKTFAATERASSAAAAVAVKPAPKPAAKKVAAFTPSTTSDAFNPAAASSPAAPAAAPASVATGGANGYVAVLASVPRSSSSRMDALKRFADMQQKYASALTGKTPDVAEANLGTKGAYHRLVVGPPASREQASSLCTQLKAQGYNDCWVTSY
ncbi:MAG: SPOR domain-containing protein [Hyphomicrobium sp.]|nr:SPOR domain-containing protein [Hyphomicrobium sp.]